MLQDWFHRLPKPAQSAFRLLRLASDRHISAHAAGICFFQLLALFPALLVACRCLRSVGLDHHDLLTALKLYIPVALHPAAGSLLKAFFAADAPGLLSLTALLAVWSASRGIYGLMQALNALCDLNETRGYVRRRLICAVWMLLALVLMPLALMLRLGGNLLMQYIIPLFVLTLIFAAIYRAFPDTRLPARSCLAGGAAAGLLWQLFSAGFSLYAAGAGSYSIFYGTLSYGALGLLWLYFSMQILLLGGLIASRFERRHNNL